MRLVIFAFHILALIQSTYLVLYRVLSKLIAVSYLNVDEGDGSQANYA